MDLIRSGAAALARMRHASLQGPLANAYDPLIHAPQAFCKALLASELAGTDFKSLLRLCGHGARWTPRCGI